ncbi:TIGR04190 family B12-binding domain/radical SAM domain protein, partial [Neobacillus niacini]
KDEVDLINRHSICGENELKWEVKKLFANVPSLTLIGMELLIKDVIKDIKCKLGKIDRNTVIVTRSQGSE